MKTAQRILATSLELFNQEGESSVTSVDIANELDISPGNLYYHFKGKEVIVDALFALHVEQFEKLISAGDVTALSLEEQFYYLYLLLEKIHLYRFLYRSPMDLMEKYPHVQKGMQRLVKKLEAKLEAMFEHAAQNKYIQVERSELKPLVEIGSLVMIQSSQYFQIKQSFDDDTQIYDTLNLLLTMLMPRMHVPVENLSHLQQSIAMHAFTRGDE
ncbi:TetR/AcrR family transcriptional regulator [Alteromonas facilis]|uniref:TetR/AcrR family transcriptional regulator n=1 Tax=Alteromonas facilis TaxID=2048004 RepID=UPI000C28815C|nr:TetR/AcrR family transcriptional regulator [Alteromonas facilis]